MVKKTHIQGGLMVSLLTNPLILDTMPNEKNLIYKIILTGVYIGGSCVGSLLPDIDMKSSYISRTLPLLHKLYGKRFKHRGFTHSILALFILLIWSSLISYLVLDEPGISLFVSGVFVGCVSHVFLDLFTKEGVKLLSPIGKTVSLASIKTSSRKEKKLNKYFDFAIFMMLGVNMYIAINSAGVSVMESISDLSLMLKN